MRKKKEDFDSQKRTKKQMASRENSIQLQQGHRAKSADDTPLKTQAVEVKREKS